MPVINFFNRFPKPNRWMHVDCNSVPLLEKRLKERCINKSLNGIKCNAMQYNQLHVITYKVLVSF